MTTVFLAGQGDRLWMHVTNSGSVDVKRPPRHAERDGKPRTMRSSRQLHQFFMYKRGLLYLVPERRDAHCVVVSEKKGQPWIDLNTGEANGPGLL